VTAEQLEKTPSLGPGDEIGQSGLQAAYQERLGGAAARKIVVRDRETGAAGTTLLERPGRRARPLRTTLDLRVRRRPRRRSRRSMATRHSSPSSPRPATSSRWPTAPRTRPTTAR
jgi:hypothetical protein